MTKTNDSISLLYAVQEASDALEEGLAPIIAEAGLSSPQFSLLFYIVEQGPLRLGELARKERCVKSNISNLIRKMENQGWVTLRPADEDGRAKLIEASAEGLS